MQSLTGNQLYQRSALIYPAVSPAGDSGERGPELGVHPAVDDGVADAGGHAEPIGGRVEVAHSGPLGHPAVCVVHDLSCTAGRGDGSQGGRRFKGKYGGSEGRVLNYIGFGAVGHVGGGGRRRVVSSLDGMPTHSQVCAFSEDAKATYRLRCG